MNLELYRSETTTVPWTIDVKPQRIIRDIPVRDAIHSLLGRTMLMGGRGRYFNQQAVSALSVDDWKTLNNQAAKIEGFLQERSNVAPTDDDVQRVFSQVYHLWNEADPTGLESRRAISKALDVLGLGKALPLEEAFPQFKNSTSHTAPASFKS